MKQVFQFTHPGKGATRAFDLTSRVQRVSIHAPWEGCDLNSVRRSTIPLRFQFTHPGKGATCQCGYNGSVYPCFNSRTLGRVRPQQGKDINYEAKVSIHAPWEGCDNTFRGEKQPYKEFQFTHPGKGATRRTHKPYYQLRGFNSRTLGRVRHKLNNIR